MAYKQVLISLDHIHCYKQNETFGSEPYLLTAFFKIDGDTIEIDLNDHAEFFLNGPCTFVGTTGSHGNLGDTDVRSGDDVPIPPALGEVEFTLKPIGSRAGLPHFEIAGSVGVVVALLEEEAFTDDAAEAGRAAFNRTVERGINEIFPTFRKNEKEKPTPEDIAALAEEVKARIRAAVIDAQGVFRNFLSFFDPDHLIGADVFYSSNPQEIDKRFRRIVPIPQPFPNPPLQLLTDDYGLFGKILVFGKADIVWHNSQTNETQIWLMDGHRVAGRATVVGENGQPAVVGPPFRIVGVGVVG